MDEKAIVLFLKFKGMYNVAVGFSVGICSAESENPPQIVLSGSKKPFGSGDIVFFNQRDGVQGVHTWLPERKNYESITGNNINHPNDYIHRIYAKMALEVLLPEQEN